MSDITGTCPKCDQAWCYVELYSNGQKHKYYRDSKNPDEKLGFLQAFSLLKEINESITKEKKRFNPAAWQPESIKARLLTNVLVRWIEQKKEEVKNGELSYGTLHAYQSRTRTHLSPLLGHLDVKEIKFSDIENFKDQLPNTIKLKTKREILNTLHAAMRWMWKKGIISEVPPFPTINGNDSEPRIALTLEDQAEALNKIPEIHRDVYEFEFETGIRPGETCALKIKDIDFQNRTMRVQRTFTMRRLREADKEAHRKTMPLSDVALEIARARSLGRFPEDWVFINPSSKSHYTVQRLGHYWKKYTKLPCTHYEGGRHSFCTQISEVAEGVAAQALMRHADARSTARYTHSRTEFLRDVLSRRSSPRVVPISAKKT
jgi:integrase